MIKYVIPYKSYDNASWLLSLDVKGYDGEPIIVDAVTDKACHLFYSSSNYFSLWESTIVNLKAEFYVYNKGQINIEELLLLGERECTVQLTRNGDVKFFGYLDVNDLNATLTAPPYDIRFRATTGFEFL